MEKEQKQTNATPPVNAGAPINAGPPVNVGSPQGGPGGADAGKKENSLTSAINTAKEISKALLTSSENEQKPAVTPIEGLKQYIGSKVHKEETGQAQHTGMPQANAASRSLFEAMDAPLHGLTPDDVHYVNEVDAALARRPKFGARALSITVALFFACLIIWAAVADIDEVTHSDGQVVGSQRTQTIQNLEGGILRSINVYEGQIVEKGEILAQLDNEIAESSYRDNVSKAIENRLALIRLEAELNKVKPDFPTDLRAFLTRNLGQNIDNRTMSRARQILQDQKSAYESREALLNSELQVLKAQYEQREHEVAEQESHMKQLEHSLQIAREQLNTASELLKRKNFAKMEYLNLEQKKVELEGQLNMLKSTLPKTKAAAIEARQRMVSREAEQKAQITEEISKRRIELTSLHETLSAGGDRVTRTELRAPVRGTVKQIYINTVGGVVKSGEPIMDLVPLDDTLLVESKVTPKDVAFLHPGQDVKVKVSAYDFSIYGGLDGKLESISADTIEDKRGDFYYLVKVRTQQTAITHNNEILPIIPGMMVTADILIGKKTVLDYLMKPILKAKQNALRER